MYRLAHQKKNYSFTPNSDFDPLFTRFNFTEFLRTSIHSEYASTSREKRTSKHGITIALKLVSIECQKKDAFLAAVQLGGNRLTFQNSAPSQHIIQGDQYGGLSFVYSWAAKNLLSCIFHDP